MQMQLKPSEVFCRDQNRLSSRMSREYWRNHTSSCSTEAEHMGGGEMYLDGSLTASLEFSLNQVKPSLQAKAKEAP